MFDSHFYNDIMAIIKKMIQHSNMIVSIEAVYDQTGTVYETDSLDSLKTDLTVTANYDDGTSAVLDSDEYTLTGTLSYGTSTITVTAGEQTDTFIVSVSYLITTADLQQGGFLATGMNDSDSGNVHNKRVRSTGYFPLTPGTTYKVEMASDSYTLDYSVSFYTADDFSTARISASDWALSGVNFTAPAGGIFGRICFKTTTDHTFTPANVTALHITLA